MADITPIYKVLVAQARLNSHIISVLGTLAKHSNPGSDRDELIEALRSVMNSNQESLDLLKAAVNSVGEEGDGS